MYQEFYGLRERPFELTSNPKYLYMTEQHQEALSNVQYGLSSAKAATVLIGEAGTGKTTLLQTAIASERCRQVRCIWVNNPALTRTEFLELVARDLGLSAEAARSKTVLLEELENALRDSRSRGIITALIVDEAQSLSIDLLEEIRLFANIETAADKLLPLVLAGQPEFAVRLENPNLRQLKQRVALRCELRPLTLRETSTYILTRIGKAGGSATRLFTREAVVCIHEHAAGIPRTINVLCDNALLHGFALGRQPVNREIVLDVCRDFKLGDRVSRPAAPVPGEVRKSFVGLMPVDPAPVDVPIDEPDTAVNAGGARRFSLFGARRG